jgi:hypothetical protein
MRSGGSDSVGAAYGRRPQPQRTAERTQEGDRHIVAASPTGGWVAIRLKLQAYQTALGLFFTPKKVGSLITCQKTHFFTLMGASGDLHCRGAAETSAKLGINATADDSTRLFVIRVRCVFARLHGSRADGNAQVVINKALSPILRHIFSAALYRSRRVGVGPLQ